MSRKSFGVVGVAVVALALVAGVVLAQGSGTVTFETSFAFLVNGKEMPAGRYAFELQGPVVLKLLGLGSNQAIFVKTTTRLAGRSDTEGVVIFDKAGDSYYLAEVYLPGLDGFDIQGAPGEHTHVKVAATP